MNQAITQFAFATGLPRVLGDFEPAVDLATLATLEELQEEGEPNLIVELIDLFLADVPCRLSALRASLVLENYPALKRGAHSLRGSSGSLGALRTSALCEEIEMEPADAFASLAALLTSLEAELARVFPVLQAQRLLRL
ncbi:MAG: hypothetical protein QOD33_1732 [Pyrinomonadaceae bacterium]|jgi:HPt (histidine-containing phosphotransfer) domain-containing protein|nr:hypothetical protein [Pyrinomonadaceae bacterium]